MNVSKKSCKNYLLLLLKAFPLVYIVAGVLHGNLDLATMNSYWSNFGVSDIVVDMFNDLGFTIGPLGVAMIGYFNYLVMLHVLECLAAVVLFVPDLFLSLFEKLSGDY